jgi:hypothetical protein
MTGPEHYRAAEQLQQHARAVMKAKQGPPASLFPAGARRAQGRRSRRATDPRHAGHGRRDRAQREPSAASRPVVARGRGHECSP